jgi:hypothetical protein
MRILGKAATVLIALGLLAGGAARADSIYTFDTGVSLNQQTSFGIADNGITASFTTNYGSYEVANSSTAAMAAPFSGNYLYDDGLNYASLIVNFSSAVTSVSLDFATETFSTVEIMAYSGVNLVGSNSASGSVPGGYYFPQGTLTYGGTSFNQIVISDSGSPAIAVDNIDVQLASLTAPLPAASAAVPCLAGVTFLGSWLGRRFRRQTA